MLRNSLKRLFDVGAALILHRLKTNAAVSGLATRRFFYVKRSSVRRSVRQATPTAALAPPLVISRCRLILSGDFWKKIGRGEKGIILTTV